MKETSKLFSTSYAFMFHFFAGAKMGFVMLAGSFGKVFFLLVQLLLLLLSLYGKEMKWSDHRSI